MNIYGIKKFCKDDISLIENYDKAINDKTQLWDCHHRLEIELKLSKQQLKNMGLYYNRPANELIFLTHSEHTSLHGYNQSDEKKQKISNTLTGIKRPQRTEEHKQHISEALKGRKLSEEHKQHISEGNAGEKNGFYGKHHTEESKQKMSDSLKGKIPWNKGKTGISSDETKQKIREANLGKKLIIKDNVVKRVKKEEVQKYIDEGWKLGRK